MSKIFYDHLIKANEIENLIKNSASTPEEREELWSIVDEIIHHKVLGCILDKLPKDFHLEFLNRFHKSPYDEGLIIYLNEKLDGDIEIIIREKIRLLIEEIVSEINQEKNNG